MCFIFNLLATLLKITTANLHGAKGFKLAIGLEKICVHMEWTTFTSRCNWGVRPNEAGWSFAWDFLNILGLAVVDLVEVGNV
jgi:hypothetical protein